MNDAFEWLTSDRRHLRSNLLRVEIAIRRGQLDGLDNQAKRGDLFRALDVVEGYRLTRRENRRLDALYLEIAHRVLADLSSELRELKQARRQSNRDNWHVDAGRGDEMVRGRSAVRCDTQRRPAVLL
jgi:hypothetical protein